MELSVESKGFEGEVAFRAAGEDMLNRRHSLIVIAAIACGLTSLAVAQSPVKKPAELPVPSVKPAKPTTNTTIYIKNMHCEGCAKRLRTRLYKLPGVVKVTTNVKLGTAVVVPAAKKPVKTEQLWDATIAERFAIKKVTTPKGTFLKRPAKPVKPKVRTIQSATTQPAT
ncbi:MAG: heavy-metal-associated domain-containing protein [Planctomycetota bacterium]